MDRDYLHLVRQIEEMKTILDRLKTQEEPVKGWRDHPLYDPQGEGNHFREYTNTYPTGWTETDAAAQTNQDDYYSFWYLKGSSGDTTWDYRKQTDITIEDLDADTYGSFQVGPLLFRGGGYASDLTYYFGIYGETGGAIDTSKYVRVRIRWDSVNSLWQVRGESDANDGGGQTASSEISLGGMPILPLYARLTVRNNATKSTRSYIGAQYWPAVQTLLTNVAENTTWGQVWWRFSMSRPASGVADYLYIGAVDYPGNVA